MDHIDPETARRVWQRVQGNREPEQSNLSFDMLMEQTVRLSRLYLRYAEQVYGARRNQLQRMAHQLQNQSRNLRQMWRNQKG